MNKKSMLLGICTGALTGALTSILLAPKSGRELRKDIASKSGEASVILKELIYNINELMHSAQILGTEGTTLLKDMTADIKESLSKWNKEVEPEKNHFKTEIKEIKKTISDLEKTLKKDAK